MTFSSIGKQFLLIFCIGLIIFFILPIKLARAHSSVVVIKMTSGGFVPSELTIDENTTLNFINEDSVDRWPASDLHPTHEEFPEFDPKKPIPPGEVWLFKPAKVGAWKFHDHLLAHQRGIITVTTEKTETNASDSAQRTEQPTVATSSVSITNGFFGGFKLFVNKILFHFFGGLTKIFGVKIEASPVPNIVVSPAEFKKLPQTDQFAQLKTIAKAQKSEAAWKFIQSTYQGEGGTSGNVHDLAHLSGQILFEEQGLAGLKSCTPQFAFGCFHGFLDIAFRDSIADLEKAEIACQSLGQGMSGPVASCIHGIGHGVASFHKTTDLKNALVSCDRLSDPAGQYCYDGVFMEFERNATASFYKSDNPLYPCDEFGSQYAFSCGRNQPQVLMQRFKKTFPEVASICLGAANADFKSACFDALGFMAATQGQGIPQQIVGLCQQIPETSFANQCLKAAAGEIVFQEMPKWYEVAPQVCAASSETQTCHAYVEQLMQDYGRIRPRAGNEDKNTYVQKQMAVCHKLGGRDDCYQQVAQVFSDQFDLAESLALLKSNESVPAVYARCHEVTHYLSRAAFAKTHSVPQTYAQCDSTCHGGCYHGTLEAYLKEKQLSVTNSRISEAITSVCGKPTDYENVLIFYECLHGLGHAGMFITDMEVPDSLKLCDVLPSLESRERCYSGVFMENSSSSTSTDHPGKYVKADDPMYPCNSLEEKYQKLCYRYQSSHFALITKHNWSAVADLCLKVPAAYQEDCFRTVGTNQVGFTQDFSLMKNNCALMPTEFQGTCYAGVIGSLAYRFVGDMVTMETFCAMLPVAHQPLCLKNVGTSILDWTSDQVKRTHYCNQLQKSDFTQWCREGIVAAGNQIGAAQVFN